MALRSGLPLASRCSWPTNSSSDWGRMRSASGRNGSDVRLFSFVVTRYETGLPMTSTPAGGEKLTSSAVTGPLRTA